MILIVLATICSLAYVFLVFVLFQWTRDTKRKTTTRSAEDDVASEKKRPQVVGSRRTVGRNDHFSGKSRWVQSMRGRSRGCGPGCNKCERVSYQKVARSLRSGKRS
jgi:hypothetical protein